jgi:hypothetical protein
VSGKAWKAANHISVFHFSRGIFSLRHLSKLLTVFLFPEFVERGRNLIVEFEVENSLKRSKKLEKLLATFLTNDNQIPDNLHYVSMKNESDLKRVINRKKLPAKSGFLHPFNSTFMLQFADESHRRKFDL